VKALDPDDPDARKELVEEGDQSLLELLDHVLDKGVVIDGELVLGLADVDLIYVRLSALVCAADHVMPAPKGPPKQATSLPLRGAPGGKPPSGARPSTRPPEGKPPSGPPRRDVP
jgi:hypothetical protein